MELNIRNCIFPFELRKPVNSITYASDKFQCGSTPVSVAAGKPHSRVCPHPFHSTRYRCDCIMCPVVRKHIRQLFQHPQIGKAARERQFCPGYPILFP